MSESPGLSGRIEVGLFSCLVGPGIAGPLHKTPRAVSIELSMLVSMFLPHIPIKISMYPPGKEHGKADKQSLVPSCSTFAVEAKASKGVLGLRV